MTKFLNLKSLLIITFVLVVLLAAGQFVVSNEMSTQGEEILRLESERVVLQKEVAALSQEASQLGSLSRVQEEAQGLGFIYSPTAVEFILPPKLAHAQ